VALPRHRKGAGQADGSADSAEPNRAERETRSKAAKATGYSHDTLKKVEEVRTTAEDETQPEDVREEAKLQHEGLMEGTVKADPAVRTVRDAKRRADRRAKEKAKLATGLGPGQWIEPPAPPKPTVTLGSRLVDGISKGRGLEKLAVEIQESDLDLDAETIVALRKRLRAEIRERRQLDAALKGVLDKRKATT
jgi:hypothetical protein